MAPQPFDYLRHSSRARSSKLHWEFGDLGPRGEALARQSNYWIHFYLDLPTLGALVVMISGQ